MPKPIHITSLIFRVISAIFLPPYKWAIIGVRANIIPLIEKNNGFEIDAPIATPDNSVDPALPATIVSVRPIAVYDACEP